MNELVSIIIPTYKQGGLLSRSIESALGQTYDNVEIIVVDDNSPETDDRRQTENVMRQYEDIANITYVKHPVNLNGSAARNTGARNSKGKYLAFLDDDDEYLPEKISSMMKNMMSRDESWGACYSNYLVKRPNGTRLHYAESREGQLLVDALGRNLMLAAGSNLLVRRNVFEELNGFDESFQRNQDLEFLVRLMTKYKIAYEPTLGLIVNQQIKTGDRKVDFIGVTEQYLKTFAPFINKLIPKEKNKVESLIKLQLFRHHLFAQRDVVNSIKMILNGDVGLGVSTRYFIHLLGRSINKTVKGFNI